MKVLFWVCLLLIGYAYIGYAILLAVEALFRKRPILRAAVEPSVSVIIAAKNEEKNLPAKLQDLQRIDYSQDRLQVVIASDGSTDRTVEMLEEATGVVPVVLAVSGGKARALNAAVAQATGDVLVFMDVRQQVDSDAVKRLVACLSDPYVGAVSGELLLETAAGSDSPEALGIYWRIEKLIRRLESESGSVVGVTGAIYAMRKELFVPIPAGTILDDVYVPMQVVRKGKRVVFEPSAIARDRVFKEKGKEFARKVRTLTGNYQLLRLAPWLLTSRNPLLFRFISHKLLRLLVPMLMVLLLVASALTDGVFYKTIFVLQLLFYCLAAAGKLSPPAKKLKVVSVANTFVMLNVAAAVAFYNFVSRRDNVWV